MLRVINCLSNCYTFQMNEMDFKLSSYDYQLPEELIAKYPAAKRSDARLLVYQASKNKITHTTFNHLADYLPEKSLLVRNNSKVFPCRLFGKKNTGGQAEIFLLSLLAEEGLHPALIKASGKRKVGDEFIVNDQLKAKLIKIDQGKFWIEFNLQENELNAFIQDHGKMPLPPYIDRDAEQADLNRYQTVYARTSGSVAAPTAGLHFNDEVFKSLKDKEINTADVTLHVGIGTFRPVETDDIRDHHMHFESYEINENDLTTINSSADNIIAVGTTSLRVLESSVQADGSFEIKPGVNETDIFLYPSKEIHSIRGMVTNFHLPKSSLMMLVSTLIGREQTLKLYQEAIEKEYRFYSYGDAMLILR